MKTGTRSLFVVAGLALLFLAFSVLIAKPLPHLAPHLPPAAIAHNIPYFLYLRLAQWLFGSHAGTLMAANGLLMLAVCGLVFRVGWGFVDSRYRLLGAAAAMLVFELNPLVIVLPLTLGFLGGYLLVPLFLLLFISVMLSVENWSAFMKAIILAVAWSFFLWVHLPAAILVLVAMIPWVLYSRRPTVALGIFLTVIILGTALFTTVWATGCLLAHHLSLIQGPIDMMHRMWGYLQEGIAAAGNGGSEVLKDRIVHVTAWFSPFWLTFGLWTSGKALIRMLRERRASTPDLAALVSLVVLVVVLICPGKDTLPGAWYLLMVAAMWSPLIAKSIATKENFFSRGSRLTFTAGFLVCGGTLWALRQDISAASLLPDAAALLELTIAIVITGGITHAVLKKHPLSIEHRVQALLAGSTLAYFLVLDGLLLR